MELVEGEFDLSGKVTEGTFKSWIGPFMMAIMSKFSLSGFATWSSESG